MFSARVALGFIWIIFRERDGGGGRESCSEMDAACDEVRLREDPVLLATCCAGDVCKTELLNEVLPC